MKEGLRSIERRRVWKGNGMSSKIDVKHHAIGELQVTRVEEMCHLVSPPHD